jgi:hypothetical protein
LHFEYIFSRLKHEKIYVKVAVPTLKILILKFIYNNIVKHYITINNKE